MHGQRYLIALALALGVAAPVLAQTFPGAAGVCPGIIGRLPPLSFKQISVGATAVGLVPPTGARMAVIQIDSNSVRYREDGTAPTASIGVNVAAAGYITVCEGTLGYFQMIQNSGAATANVAFYGQP